MSMWIISWNNLALNYITLNLTAALSTISCCKNVGKQMLLQMIMLNAWNIQFLWATMRIKIDCFLGRDWLMYSSYDWICPLEDVVRWQKKKRKRKRKGWTRPWELYTENILFNVLPTSGLMLENASLKCFKFLFPNFPHFTMLN